MTVVFACVGIALSAAACGNDGGPVCDDTDGPNVLEIGDTSLASPAAFVPLEAGDLMRVVVNAHGLFALQPALRVRGLFPGEAGRVGHEDDPRIAIHAFLGETFVGGTNVAAATGEQVDEEPLLGLTPTTDDAELLGVALVFLSELDPLDYLNETLELRGEITDACNETASATLEVVAHWEY